MKINNQTMLNNIKSNDSPIEVKQGEVYSAAIKERLPNNEAVVQIRGKELKVQFEDGVPQKDRVDIQVTGSKNGFPLVKTVLSITQTQEIRPELDKILREAGVPDSPELKQMAKILLDQKLPVSKEVIQQLKVFLERAQGTISQKLETVQALTNKRLEITPQHLFAVHEALHGQPIFGSMTDVLKEYTSRLQPHSHKPTGQIIESRKVDSIKLQPIEETPQQILREAIKEVIKQLQNSSLIENAMQTVMEQVLNNKTIPTELLLKIEKAFNESQLLLQKGHIDLARQWLLQAITMHLTPTIEGASNISNQLSSDTSISDLIEKIQSLPKMDSNLKSFIDQVRHEIVPHKDLPEHQSKALNKTLNEVEILIGSNQEGRAKERLTNALERIKVEIPLHKQVSNALSEITSQSEIELSQDQGSSLLGSILSDLSGSTKQFIVTEVTRKLSELTIDFKSQTREIIRNLDNIIHMIRQAKSQSFPHVKSLLESTIDKLDRAILKSEMMLYSDMKTEKQLLVSSSQLAEARNFLAKGNYDQALQILNTVKDRLTKLHWQPADIKVKHLLMKEITSQVQPNTYTRQIIDAEELTSTILQQKSSARAMYETIRAIGVNHDSEVAQSLSNNSTGADQFQLQKNMKAVLMGLLNNDAEVQSQHRQSVEQILQNITGQQLLSKNDVGANVQTLFLNIPYQFQEQKGDLKLYVNAKKEGDKIDWENCSLYFLLDTKKLGETGILISAVDRKLAITIKNDQALLKEKMSHIAERHKQNLQEIGYHISNVQFTHLHAEEKAKTPIHEESMTIPVVHSNISKRGFDSKI